MRLLALEIGSYNINPPSGVPQFGNNGAGSLISFGITVLIVLAIILALIYLLWNALRWITSEGDKQKIQGARQGITYAIIGLLVAFFAIFIINVIGAVFGIDLTGHPIPQEQAKCPDGSGNFYCGKTANTQCPLCSPDASCQQNVKSIASCSGTSHTCSTDADCYGNPISCPAGETGQLACQNSACITLNCHPIGQSGGSGNQSTSNF